MTHAVSPSASPTRRAFLRSTSAALALLGVPEALWAMQSGEEMVRLTDYTDDFKIDAQASNPFVRCVDHRNLTSWVTANDDFYAFHQTVTPTVDPATFRLRISGLVDRPREFTLDELMARKDRRDEAVTLECSGNSNRPTRMAGLLSNGVWTGVPLATVLKESGVKADAREVVFLGADLEKEKKWQAGNREFEAPHGRSVYVQDALHPDALLAFHLNGKPLPPKNGFPLRLILPGWYGMTQVKWLSRIHLIDRRYEGQHQVRNYLSLRAHETPEGTIWLDQSISRTNMKSIVARVTRRRRGADWEYRISGPAWGGQVPIQSVEVKVDEGPWQKATLGDQRGKYAWTLWSFSVKNLTPGLHKVVSRAIDANGTVQPTEQERRARLASGREDNAQWTREIDVAG